VVSDWRDYLLSLLRKALDGGADGDFQSILMLRSIYPGVAPTGLVAKDAPTPRQLKEFVNQIGAVCRQRTDVPLVHVAYYALLRRDRVPVAQWLVEGTLPHPTLAYLFRGGVREDLAALYFGTTQSDAQQLLLRPALEEAFAAGNAEVVGELKDRTGFREALDGMNFPARAADGGVELTRATYALSSANALKGLEHWARAVLDRLSRDQKSWRLDGREGGIGLAVLLNRISLADDSTLRPLLRRVVATPIENDPEGVRQLQGLAGAADEFGALGRSGNLHIKLEVPPERLVSSLASFGKQITRPKFASVLELSSTPDELASALLDGMVSQPLEAEQALAVLSVGANGIPIDQLWPLVVHWLRDNDPVNPQQLDVLLGVLAQARTMYSRENVLAGAADNGILTNVTYVAHSNGWFKGAAEASMLHLASRPNLSDPEALRQSPTDTQILRNALADPANEPQLVAFQLTWLKKHKRGAFSLLMSIARDETNAWVNQQLGALSDAGDLVTSPHQYAQKWKYLRAALGSDRFAEHTRKSLGNTAGRKKLLSKVDDPEFALTLLDAAAAGPAPRHERELWHRAKNVLNTTPTEDWAAALQDPEASALIELALRLSGTSSAPSDPPGLEDALYPHFQALAAGETVWQPDGPTFKQLTHLLSPGARKSVASQLCAQLEGRDGHVDPALLPTYGDFLSEESAFRTHQKLPNVLERFVAQDAWDAVEWFVRLARDHSDTLKDKTRKEEMRHLRTKIAEKLEIIDEGAAPALDDLASLLNVRRKAG
jgi:hypothetical protein